MREKLGGRCMVIATALVIVGGMLFGLAPVAQADTSSIPALTKSAVFTIGSTTLTVDGKAYTMDVAPYIDSNGRTEVPVRYLASTLGMNALWDAGRHLVALNEQNFSAQENLVIGSDQLGWANGPQAGMTTMDTRL